MSQIPSQAWLPLASSGRVQDVAEEISFPNYSGWIANSYYGNGGYPSASVVQPSDHPTVFHDDSFISSQLTLPPQFGRYDATAQSPQLLSSTSAAGTSLPTMAPPPNPRKRKAPTLLNEDWEPVKARVIELRITQKKPLREVKQIVEEEFKSSGFSAT